MTDSSAVMQRCISLASGVLSPDLRVNYEFGLVLGVDEFRQEQLYHLEKNYLHQRALHGYGTVSGLKVLVDLVTSADDYQISVTPGIGIDQIGRSFLVRSTQCAFLGAWLARQPAGSIPAAGEDGLNRVYVVASYDECTDALVTIAGQPCASSDQTQAPSRIRDSVHIELRWQPPAMPAWDAIRRFAWLMSDVDIVDGLSPDDADEAVLADLVRLLDDAEDFRVAYDAGLEPGATRRVFRLAAGNSREALDRLFTVWITEVRPRLIPDLLDPHGTDSGPAETAILLARIDLAIDASGDQPVVVGDPTPPVVSDEGRPYLLHTQLIQELLLLGGGETILPEFREFVSVDTLTEAGGEAAAAFRLWFHLDEPIVFMEPPAEVEDRPIVALRRVDRDDFTFKIEALQDPPAGPAHTWRLTPSRVQLADGELLTLRFDANLIRVGSADGPTLTEFMRSQRLTFVGYDGDHHIEAYHFVNVPPPVPEPEPGLTLEQVLELLRTLRTLPLVTISPVASEPEKFVDYELWFHLDLLADGYEGALEELNLTIYAEIFEDIFPMPFEIIDRPKRNVYVVRVFAAEADVDLFGQHSYLRFAFPLDAGNLIKSAEGSFGSLREYIKAQQVKFEGYFVTLKETGEEALVVYSRLQQTKLGG